MGLFRKKQNKQPGYIAVRAASADPTGIEERYSIVSADSGAQEIYDLYYDQQEGAFGTSVRAFIDLRVGKVIGDGLTVEPLKKDRDISRELAFANMIVSGPLSVQNLFQIQVTSEIEGKSLLILDVSKRQWEWSDGDREVQESVFPEIMNVSGIENNYVVVPGKSISMLPERLWIEKEKFSYNVTSAGVAENSQGVQGLILNEGSFSYSRSGKPNDINSGLSIWPLLLVPIIQIETQHIVQQKLTLDHGIPTMGHILKDPDRFQALKEYYEKNPPKAGQYIITSDDVKYVQPNLDHEYHRSVIITCLEAISRGTGLPMAVLSPVPLGSKNVAAEGIEVGTGIGVDQSKLEDTCNDAMRKLFRLISGNSQKLDPDAVRLQINRTTGEDYRRIEKIFGPLAKDGMISLNTLHGRIPGVDPDEEREKMKKENEVDPGESQEIMDWDREGRSEDG